MPFRFNWISVVLQEGSFCAVSLVQQLFTPTAWTSLCLMGAGSATTAGPERNPNTETSSGSNWEHTGQRNWSLISVLMQFFTPTFVFLVVLYVPLTLDKQLTPASAFFPPQMVARRDPTPQKHPDQHPAPSTWDRGVPGLLLRLQGLLLDPPGPSVSIHGGRPGQQAPEDRHRQSVQEW